MKRRARRIPVLDACKLVFAERELGDLDAALALLGLARSESAPAKPFDAPEEAALLDALNVAAFEAEVEAEADAEDGDLPEDDGRPPGERRGERERPGEAGGDGRPPGERRGERERPGEAGGAIGGDGPPFRSYERSMVCYLLPPDHPSPDRQAEQPDYKYQSIRNGVQRVERGVSPPDAESWRVAKSIGDAGRVVSRRGKIDLRECTNRVARAEILEHLPRLKTPQQMERVEILIDADLSRGALSSDVDQLVRAFRSVGAGSGQKLRRLIRRGGSWLAGAGPIWTFAPFSAAVPRTWYIIVAGGSAATPVALEPWEALIALIGPRHHVSMVWLGDSLERHRRSWISFRS